MRGGRFRVRLAGCGWQHQVRRTIVRKGSTVVVEALNTQGMTASAKGTAENPGRNVKAKAGLSRGILATGWGSLCSMLEYKAKEPVAVNPAYRGLFRFSAKSYAKGVWSVSFAIGIPP